jgi:demethylmenaquinone methyltransferase/2-methoxy-6-polyprenyl-1,4-benzoquinol methylase
MASPLAGPVDRAWQFVRAAGAALGGGDPALRNRVKFLLLSPIYDGFYRVVPVDPHQAIERHLPPGTTRVLDLCTGTALVPDVVAAARPSCVVVGLDLSPEMLRVGRAKLAAAGHANAVLVRGDAGSLPFADASFDGVTVSYGLHELPTAVRDRAVREVARVLRVGGTFVVADLARPPRLGWLVDVYLRIGEPAHARGVLGDGLAATLRGAGFVVDSHRGPEGVLPMQLLVARRPASQGVGAG